VSEKAFVAVCEALSDTRNVTLVVPAAVGVPVIDPDEIRLSPAGNDPDIKEKLYGVLPPVAVKV